MSGSRKSCSPLLLVNRASQFALHHPNISAAVHIMRHDRSRNSGSKIFID
jgi:hypothetical protein